ncbi:unannotated protein [freshwater metagenome]|uniref:Unannotated protein n=1 Tax=freshwater metagenome TaxID=449393 RepID=A0A6J6PV15_9ZZZZ
MARSANRSAAIRHEPPHLEEAPSLDPSAIERRYLLEKARREARMLCHHDARSSSARFWVVIGTLFLFTAVLILLVWADVQRTFGI